MKRAVVLALLMLGALLGTSTAAGAATTGSRSAAIDQLDKTRDSIDETLALFKAGKAEQALAQAQAGYLGHFEDVELPLRVADPQLTLDAEGKFAEIRQSIKDGASTQQVRDQVLELRGLIDDAERTLTDKGLTAPVLVAGQSFLIIFREGLEAVLLLSVLLGYLEAAKAPQLKRPVLWGVGLAGLATLLTIVVLRAVFTLAPVGREVMEAVTALVAVGVLFWVSFWLIARLEQKRWMEFLKARVWTAVSLGSAVSLTLIGFTAVYREGFETVLFYEALLSFGTGLGVPIAIGFGLGVLALTLVTIAIFRLGQRLPIKLFLSAAVLLLMATSVAFIGNAVYELQQADLIPFHRLAGWPRLPIYLAQATGYYPIRETVVAQLTLLSVYVAGGVWMFGLRPKLERRRALPAPVPVVEPERVPSNA